MKENKKKYDGRTPFGKKWLSRKIALRGALIIIAERAARTNVPLTPYGTYATLNSWLIEMEAQEMLDGKTVNKPGRWEPV
jgi:hypothetical protein